MIKDPKMQPITINIVGIPKPQPRPRAFVRRGSNRAGVYDPGTAAEWKNRVAASIMEHSTQISEILKDSGALRITMLFMLPRPRSHLKPTGGLRKNAPLNHVSRPDLDNLAKAVLDAMMQCGVLLDDSVVTMLNLEKRYAYIGEGPGCLLVIHGMQGR